MGVIRLGGRKAINTTLMARPEQQSDEPRITYSI